MATQSSETEVTPAEEQLPAKRPEPVKNPRMPVGQVLRELNWLLLLAVGIAGGVTWVLLLTQNSRLQFFAGLLPVAGGILVGRQIKRHTNWHAAMLSLITTLSAVVTALVVLSISTGLTDTQRTGLL
nr:hypothetical protein [Herpetosiphonaceae bacterium]